MKSRVFPAFHWFALAIAVPVLAGCTRPEAESTDVRILLPSASQAQKVSSLAAVPYARLCFVANVRGDGIQAKVSACKVGNGIVSEPRAPGEEIVVQVPVGEKRVFEIYGFLRDAVTDTCPPFASPGDASPVEKIYFLGKSEEQNIAPATKEVVVTIALPETSQHVAAQLGWPASCLAGGTTTVPATAEGLRGRFVPAQATLTGANFKLHGRLNYGEESKALTGSQFQLRGRLKSQ